MPVRGSRAVVLLALALLAACTTGTAPYVARRAVFHSDAVVLRQAITDTLRAEGLRVVRDDAARGLLVAVSPAELAGGVPTRDRWRFRIAPDHVSIELHTEVRDDDAAHRWQRNAVVCDCYHYAREREMLRAIRARVTSEAASALEPARAPGADPDARACALAVRAMEP